MSKSLAERLGITAQALHSQENMEQWLNDRLALVEALVVAYEDEARVHHRLIVHLGDWEDCVRAPCPDNRRRLAPFTEGQ